MEIRQAINLYLTAKAYGDAEFKVKFENPNKNLDECVLYVTYIMYLKAKKQSENGKKSMVVCVPSDDEIFGWAEAYYLNEDLKVDGKDLQSVRIVSMAATSFTDEEKAEMRKEAIQQYQDKVIAEQRKKDEERRAKQAKSKEKKPAQPVLVPDTTESGEKPAETEKKHEAEQLSLF